MCLIIKIKNIVPTAFLLFVCFSNGPPTFVGDLGYLGIIYYNSFFFGTLFRILGVNSCSTVFCLDTCHLIATGGVYYTKYPTKLQG